ncbi:hypothetical protein Hanom_Chr16g01450551 [Helianthus anomalus]
MLILNHKQSKTRNVKTKTFNFFVQHAHVKHINKSKHERKHKHEILDLMLE